MVDGGANYRLVTERPSGVKPSAGSWIGNSMGGMHTPGLWGEKYPKGGWMR